MTRTLAAFIAATLATLPLAAHARFPSDTVKVGAGSVKGEWDLYSLVQTIPADQAFRPIADGGCPLVK